MLGRAVAAVASTLFLFGTTGFAQCDYRLQYSGEYRASIFDIFIDGNDLWTASGYGIQLYDRSVDPPRLMASAGIPGLTRVVRASNGIAYAAGSMGIAVVRREGRALKVVRTIPAAAVNDLLLLRGSALFAATASGIIEFNLVDPLNPTRSPASFPTSSPSVSSLAAIGSTLFVADGDSSIESFSIVIPSSPQNSGTLSSGLRANSIAAIGTRLYVSDGQRTEIFAPNGPALTSIGSIPFPSSAIADGGSNVIFAAGRDRQIRAIDASVPANYVELFDTELVPSGGTVNRVTAMQTAGGRLYVGGGDTGLSTYDISKFTSPFPLRAYGIGPATSVVVLPNAVYSGRTGGGIQEMTRSSTGTLVTARQWSSAAEVVQDGASGFLISSSGAKLSFWTLTSTVPTLISATTFRAVVRTAFLAGSAAIALLDDGTLWTADMSQNAPVPVRVAAGAGRLSQLAHSGGGTAATEISEDGTTTINYWDAAFGTPSRTVVPGVSTALALNASLAAVFTFRGITLVQLGTPPSQPMETLLPGSNTAVIKAMEIANGKVIALTEQNTLRIWDIAAARLEKEFVVPGGAVALDAAQESTVAAIATSTGIAAINYGTATSLPSLVARSGGNSYYKKAAATASRLYLFDGRIVDVYELGSTPAPRSLTSVFAPGAIDIAASPATLFTLSNNGVVTAFSRDGVQTGTNTLNEGSDVVPLAIAVVNGAPWISFSRGCTTTGCEKRTVVLDPQSLVRTASLAGGIVDVTTSGISAYALFDLPSEVRVYDVSDPLHPAALTSRPADVAAVSIAYANGTVYLLGDRAYAYSESSLTRTGEQLTAQSPSSLADLVIDNGCATISGRSAFAETYALPQWAAGSSLAVPGTIRSMTMSGGRLIILTDYSIEVWARSPVPNPPRRKAVGGGL